MGVLKSVRNWAKRSDSLGVPPELIERIPALAWTTDLEFRLTSLTGAVLEALSIYPERYLNRPASLIFRQSNSNSKAPDAHELAISGASCTVEMEVTDREFQAHVEPLRDAEGKIVGAIGIAVDNTEGLVAQRALRISEQNYRSLIEELPHAICRCTASGALLQVNRAMLEMLGYAECDLLVLNLQTEVFAYPGQYTEFLGKLGGHRSCYGFETQWLRHDGEAVSVSLGGRAVEDSSGETAFIDLIAENISTRKQLETQLRHAQKMQAVGQFAGGIAHDFNNLLTVIRGQIEMISSEMLGRDDLRSRLAEVERAAEGATALTRQLLAFSRRQVLQAKTLDLNSVIADMTQMLSRLIGEDIELVFLPGRKLWPVKIDPGQLEQLLMNLAANARDAMPGGGQLTIETCNLGKQAISKNAVAINIGDCVRLTVRDTGQGMDEVTKARIFEPFFTTKDVGKGTGLGLSVVYGVVQQSGGHVSVESQPNAGTLFQIYLPRSQGMAESVSERIREGTPSGTETILLVEDNESVRHMATGFLRNHGYHVLTAKDGVEAIQLATTHDQIALLLSDMMMPKMGGRELARKLTGILPQIKVILMSGHPEDAQYSTHDVYFLQKPFSMLSLATTVREVLDNRRAMTQSPALMNC